MLKTAAKIRKFLKGKFIFLFHPWLTAECLIHWNSINPMKKGFPSYGIKMVFLLTILPVSSYTTSMHLKRFLKFMYLARIKQPIRSILRRMNFAFQRTCLTVVKNI